MSTTSLLTVESLELPLLPLRDVVVFPHMVIPLFVGRPKSIKALEAAMVAGKGIMLVAQKSAVKDEPGTEDLYSIGCVANILQMLKLPDGTVKVLVEGTQRAQIGAIASQDDMFIATVLPVAAEDGPDHEIEALRRAVIAQFDQYVKLNKKIPPEILTSIASIEEAGRLADTIAAHLPLKLEQKQEVLEMFETRSRIERLLSQLETEIDILQVEKRIRGRVKRQMEKSQREYYLNEQVKAIQKELGEGEDGADYDELEKKATDQKIGEDIGEKLSSTPATITRLYRPSPEGCEECGHAGYKGRMGIYEVLDNSVEIQKLIVANATSNIIQDQAIKEGMMTMQTDGFIKALRGQTSIEEILRVTRE